MMMVAPLSTFICALLIAHSQRVNSLINGADERRYGRHKGGEER